MARWRKWRPWRRKLAQQISEASAENSNIKRSNIKTYVKLSLAAGLVAALWYGVETQVLRPAMSVEGVPKFRELDADVDWSDRLTQRVFRNQAYMVGYSEKLGNPLWVSYEVLALPEKVTRLPRPDYFKSDWRSTRCWLVLPCIEHDDYTQSGYDRGHLAPNHVIATRYGQQAQHETFLMTNITPQAPNLNRRAWQRLEEISANYFAERFAPFQVITGPIFDAKPRHLPGYKFIAIPKSFYKIFVKPSQAGEAPKVLAFIIPQEVKGNEDLSQFLVSIRDIEQQTGLDFLHQLDDGIETYVETLIDPQSWQFNQRVANQSARY